MRWIDVVLWVCLSITVVTQTLILVLRRTDGR